MEKKVSKKALLWTSGVSLVLCFAMLIGIIAMAVGGSGSGITPSSSATRITTADMGLELWKYNGTEYVDISNGTGDIFTGGENGMTWEPGKIELAFLQVKNTGTSDVSFSVTQEVKVTDAAGAPTGLTYAVLKDMSYEDYSAAGLTSWYNHQKNAAAAGNIVLGSTGTLYDIVVAAGESTYFVVAVQLDKKAEASYQGITIDMALTGKHLGSELEPQTVFYVSPNGHDGNPGTEEEPIKTFRRAALMAKPGHTFIFEDGVYNETGMTVMMNSGTKDAPIVYKARNDGKVKVIYPESLCGTDCVQIMGKEYITLQGFEITQAKMADDTHPRANMDILIRVAGCNNITFRNNTMYGALEEPLKVASCSGILIEGNHIYNSGNEGVDFVNVRDSIIRNNIVEDCGRIALMCKGGSRSNLFYGNIIRNKTRQGQYAMQVGGATDNVSTWGCSKDYWEAFNVVFFNNVIVAEGEGSFIEGLSFMGAKDCVMVNNIVIGAAYGVGFRTAPNSKVQWEWDPTVDNPVFKNNIIMNSLKSAYIFHDGEDAVVNLDADYNLFYNNNGTDPVEAHSIYDKDPMFVDTYSDWHLKEGSPAIGAGTKTDEFKGLSDQTMFVGFDKDYTLRGDTWDIGVYDVDGTEKYEPGGIFFQDPAWLCKIDHTITEAPEVGSMPEMGTVLVDQNFDSTTTLEDWTECEESQTQWTIKNGMLTLKNAEMEGHYIIGASSGFKWTDYEISAKVMAPSSISASSGLVFRADEMFENMYGFRFHPESGDVQMEFCVWNSGRFSSVKYIKYDWNPGQVYDLKVIAVGEDFEFYVNGEKIGTAKDGTHAAGTAALYCYKESRIFDDVLVKSARGYEVVQMEEKEFVPEYTGRVLYEEDFSSESVMADWKQYGGEWSIKNGIMTCATGIPGENIIIYDKGYDWVNYEFTCDVRQPEKGGMWAGLIFRCNDNKTGYYGFRFVNDNTQVVKGWPGSWAEMGTKAMSTLPKGQVAQLKVVVVDDMFICYLNGQKVWEDDDKMYKKGSIGLFQQNMTEIIFDNIVVKEIVSDGVSVDDTPVDNTPTGTVVYDEDFSNPATSEQWVNLKTENGEFAYKDGQLQYTQLSDKNGSTTYLKDGYWKNFTIVLNATLPSTHESNSWMKVGFRSVDGEGGTYIYLMNLTNSDRLNINDDATDAELMVVPGGAITAFHDGKEHEIKIKVKDTTVEVLIDNFSVATYTSDKIKTDPGSIYLSAFNYAYSFNSVKVYCDDSPLLTKPEAGGKEDTFVPNGTLVLDDNMDADSTKWQGLTSENGTFAYQDGMLVYTQAEGAKNGSTLLYPDGYWKNFTLTFDALFPRSDLTTGWMRVGLRTTDGNDKPFVYFQNLSRDYLNVNDGINKINSVYGGEITKFFDGKVHGVRISVINNTIDVYIDGELKLSTTDELIEAVPGTISFACYGSGYAIDNVKVYCEDNPILTKPEGGGSGNEGGSGTNPDPDTSAPTYNEADVILKEDFADALDSSWQDKGTGTVTVENGALKIEQPAASGTFVWYTSDEASRWADYNIYFKMSAPDANGKWNGVLFHAKNDLGKYYHVRFLNGMLQFGSNSKSDIKHVNIAAAKDGNVHDICVSVKGSTIKVYVDNKLQLTVEDASIIGGTVGFGVQGCTATFDDLVVVKTGDFLPEGATDPTEPTEPTEPPYDPSTDIIEGDEVLTDDFTANETDNWEIKQTGGSYEYKDGELKYTAPTYTLYYKNGSWTNFTVTFQTTMPDTSENGTWLQIRLRTTNGSDGPYIYLRNLKTDDIRLMSGSTELAKVSGSAAAKIFDGKQHYFKVVVKDTTISLFVDGQSVLTATNDALAATPGSVSFVSYSRGYTFTDLKVYNQDAPAGGNDPDESEPTETIPDPTDVSMSIKFEDDNDLESLRPENVTVTINGTKDGQPHSSKTVVLNADGNWTKTEQMPKTDGGVTIDYTVTVVTENLPAGYTLSVNGNEITLKHEISYLLNEDFEDAVAATPEWESGTAGSDETLSGWSVADGKLALDFNTTVGTGVPVTYKGDFTEIKDFTMRMDVDFGTTGTRWLQIHFRDNGTQKNTIYLFNGTRIYWGNSTRGTTLVQSAGAYLTGERTVTLTVSGNTLKLTISGVDEQKDLDVTKEITDGSMLTTAGTIGFTATGYDFTIDNLKVINKGEPVKAKTEVTVKAEFNDGNNAAGNRIPELKVTLTGSNSYSNEVTLNEACGWKQSFKLDKYDEQGNPITYSISAPTVEGYLVSADGFTVKLLPLTTYTGSVVWEDENNADNLRPANVTIQLMCNNLPMDGEAYKKTLDEGAFTFENLPMFLNDGTAANYTVMVTETPTGYNVAVDNGTVTLRHTPDPVDVIMSVVFDDENDLDGKRPERVKVTLTGTVNGQPLTPEEIELTAADVDANDSNVWTKTVERTKTSGGVEIVYTVDVADGLYEGYTDTVAGSVITLKHVSETMLLLKEDFSDSNAIDNWTTLSSKSVGSYAVTGEKLTFTHVSGGNGVATIYNQANDIEDFDLNLSMLMPKKGSWSKILLRTNTKNTNELDTHIAVYFYHFGSSRQVKIQAGGTELEAFSVSKATFVDSNDESVLQNVKVSLSGNTITVYIAGTQIGTLTHDSLNVAGGTIGFMTCLYNATFDDIKLVDNTEYTVTWDVDGTETPETYKAGKTPVVPTEVVTDKAGYTFDGWDSNADDQVDVLPEGTFPKVSKDVTYKAIYTVN